MQREGWGETGSERFLSLSGFVWLSWTFCPRKKGLEKVRLGRKGWLDFDSFEAFTLFLYSPFLFLALSLSLSVSLGLALGWVRLNWLWTTFPPWSSSQWFFSIFSLFSLGFCGGSLFSFSQFFDSSSTVLMICYFLELDDFHESLTLILILMILILVGTCTSLLANC